MIAFYGMGGGFGHLTRIKHFIDQMEIIGDYKVITSNPKADVFFSKNELISIVADELTQKSELAEKISVSVSDFEFESLYIDVFPSGILGELTPDLIPHKKAFYLARRMKWSVYKPMQNDSIHFNTTYAFEELEKEHEHFTEQFSDKTVQVNLACRKPASIQHELSKSDKPIWLIVHSTHAEEVEVLFNHAQDIARLERVEPQFIILSDQHLNLSDEIVQLFNQNPLAWYPVCDKIFTAAGFNTWYQLSPWQAKHVCLPFTRKYDDQFWRVQQR